jgi:hypothetical protein
MDNSTNANPFNRHDFEGERQPDLEHDIRRPGHEWTDRNNHFLRKKMKLHCLDNKAFTLGEMLIASAIASMALLAVVGASISLTKSLNAADNYFATEIPQVRIADYLSRDVKRSYIVSTSADHQTVTCTLPNYIIQPGDPDAGSGNANVGKRRTPTIVSTPNGITASYLAREYTTASLASGSPSVTLSSLLGLTGFKSSDVGQSIVGNGIPSGTTILSISNSLFTSTATMSNNATATINGGTVTIGSLTTVVYTVTNQSIQRTENGALTTIAVSADKLIPQTTDPETKNTEFTQSNVTFLPVFRTNSATGQSTADSVSRTGTTIVSVSYLRNRRRGDG